MVGSLTVSHHRASPATGETVHPIPCIVDADGVWHAVDRTGRSFSAEAIEVAPSDYVRLRRYPFGVDEPTDAFSVRFGTMSEEAEAEMAEWDALLHPKRATTWCVERS